jgi:hypothetical protein
MTTYNFEGKVIETDVPEEILNRLAALAISYKMLSKDRITKAAKEQRALIKGFMYGLEAGDVVDEDESVKLYRFFMGDD